MKWFQLNIFSGWNQPPSSLVFSGIWWWYIQPFTPILSNAEPVEIATRIFTLDMNDYRVVGNPSVDTENALKTHLFCDKKGLPESKNRNGEKQPLCILDTFLDPETETSISEFVNWLFSNWMIPNLAICCP